MMRTVLIARLLLVAGVLIFLTSAAADPLGIGGASGVGWKQITGMIVGVAVAGFGITRLRSGRA